VTRLPSLSSRELIAAQRRAGFAEAPHRGKGSHRALVRHTQGQVQSVVVPERHDLPRGTLHAILQQAGLTPEQLLDLL
jgi:predicted RNA binding protein YcfA (HicA-like mRNA interferase family)